MFDWKKLGGLGAVAIFTASPAMADDGDNTVVTDQAEIPTLVVTAQKDSAILPANTDAFGLGQSQLETPRSTSTVALAMIDQYSLQTVRDLIAVTPGVFTASFYGVDGTVNVRGEYADNYYLGFKRVENQGTYVTPIQSALGLEVIRGIASPAYGTGRAGGYVNFTPRSSRATRFMNGQDAAGEFSVSGGTYGYDRESFEYGTPFMMGDYKSGLDVYIERQDAAHYFHGIEPEHKLGQIGFSTELPADWKLEISTQYYDASGMQGTTGVNRLTQDLVDHNNYISGHMAASITPSGASYINPDDITAMGGVTYFYAATSDYSRLDPDTMKTVKLGRHDVVTSKYDYGDASTSTGYINLSHPLAGGEFKLQGFYDDLDADSYNSYGFTKHLRDTASEFRASLTGSLQPKDWIDSNYVVGAGYRGYEADEGYVYASGYMVLDRQDITSGATADDIFNPTYVNGEPYDQFYHSDVDEYGAFFNTSVKFFDAINFTGGVRYDDYDVKASNTGLVDWSVALDTPFKDSDDATSWSLSLSYDTPFGLVPYVTRGRSWSLETSQGGAVSPGNVSGGTWLSPTDLTEGGVKGSFFDNQLYAAVSVYKQKRVQSELLSSNFTGARTRGTELEMRWAVNQQFGLSAVATRQKTYIAGSSTLVVTPAEMGIENTEGWGYTYEASSSAYEGLENGYVDRTQPRYVFGLFANYEMGNGFGGTLGGNYVDKTSGELPGAVVFPDYYLLRGSLHYEVGRYRFSLNVNNILDERYYIPQRSTETEGAAMPGEGRTAMAKVTIRL